MFKKRHLNLNFPYIINIKNRPPCTSRPFCVVDRMDLIGDGDLTSPPAEEEMWKMTSLAAGQP